MMIAMRIAMTPYESSFSTSRSPVLHNLKSPLDWAEPTNTIFITTVPLFNLRQLRLKDNVPRIYLGDFFMVPAGREGVDFKLVMGTSGSIYHNIVSVGYPKRDDPYTLPIYV